MTNEEIKRAHEKWRTAKYRAQRRGIDYLLTPEDYLTLIEEAGITVDQIGRGSSDYCLGRYKDEGCYILGNCRFITMRENTLEGNITKKLHGLSLGGGGYHNNQTKGINHYGSKGFVNVPWGKFECLRAASKHPEALCKMTTIAKRIKLNYEGYFYSEE